MKTEKIKNLFNEFESIASEWQGIECWSARELQYLLGYAKWENFEKDIQKAKEACRLAGENIEDHFPGAKKVIEAGKGAKHVIDDIKKIQSKIGSEEKKILKETKKNKKSSS